MLSIYAGKLAAENAVRTLALSGWISDEITYLQRLVTTLAREW